MIVDEAYGTINFSGYWDPSDFTSIDSCLGTGYGLDIMFVDDTAFNYMLASTDFGINWKTWQL
jgi:hypothetical protein